MHSKHAELFKALGVESRLKIIHILKEKGPLCVNELAEALGISASAVSQHLKVLKFAGLVKDERKGYWIPYDVEEEMLEECGEILATICDCGCHGHKNIIQMKIRKGKDKLSLLKEYEKELREELEHVRENIRDLKKE
jgi:ArsR family transcriptional regulator